MGKAVNSHNTPPNTRPAPKRSGATPPRNAPRALQRKTAAVLAREARPTPQAPPSSATRPTPPPVYKPAVQTRAGHMPQQQSPHAPTARQAKPQQQSKTTPQTNTPIQTKTLLKSKTPPAAIQQKRVHPRATPQTPSSLKRPQPPAAAERPKLTATAQRLRAAPASASVQRLRAAPANAARPAAPPSPVKPSPTRPAPPAAAALMKAAPARPASTPRPAPRAATQRGGTVQRSKLSGVGSGNLSNAEKNSGWAVYAQVDFTPTQSATTQSSNPSQTLQQVLGEDLLDDEHTHAEDKVLAIIPQRWLELKQPSTPVTFDLYITSSPCSSTYGTTRKAEGCAESLVRYYKEGVPIDDPYGNTERVKFQIDTLTVKKLYRPKGVTDAKEKSLSALVLLKHSGVCRKFVVEN